MNLLPQVAIKQYRHAGQRKIFINTVLMPTRLSEMPLKLIIHTAVPVILFKILFNRHKWDNSQPGTLLI